MNKFLACFVLIAILSYATAEGPSFWDKIKIGITNALSNPVKAAETFTNSLNYFRDHPLEFVKAAYNCVRNIEIPAPVKTFLKRRAVEGFGFVCDHILFKSHPESCEKQRESLKELFGL